MSLESLCSRHLITVKLRSATRGGAGGQIVADTLVGDKRCRAKEMTHTESAELKSKGLRGDWKFWFTADPQLDNRHVIYFTDTAGTIHVIDVVGSRNPHQLDRFWVVLGEERRDVT